MQMVIEINGLEGTVAKINKIAVGLVEGMEPALIQIGELGSKYFGGVAFQSKGSAFNEPWEPLAESTVREKDRHWKGRPDMVRTSELLNSFSYELTGPNSVRLYNAAPWFVYHQSAEPREKLPRRIMIGVNQSLHDMVEEAIRTQAAAVIKAAL